jgi:hypothetical protein
MRWRCGGVYCLRKNVLNARRSSVLVEERKAEGVNAGFPALRRASLRRETIEVKVGQEAEVPPTTDLTL